MTVCDRERGVKNHQKKRDILYGRPLTMVRDDYEFGPKTPLLLYLWLRS